MMKSKTIKQLVEGKVPGTKHIHVHASGEKHKNGEPLYKVHSVGTAVHPDHVKVGDSLRSSDLDDLSQSFDVKETKKPSK